MNSAKNLNLILLKRVPIWVVAFLISQDLLIKTTGYGTLENARLIRDNALFIGVHSGLTDDNFENFRNVADT